MFRALASVAVVLMLATGGAAGQFCGAWCRAERTPARSHHASAKPIAAFSVTDDWDRRGCAVGSQSLASCARWDGRHHRIGLGLYCRIGQAIDPRVSENPGVSLALQVYQLVPLTEVHAFRRHADARVPLERSPLSMNLRI